MPNRSSSRVTQGTYISKFVSVCHHEEAYDELLKYFILQ